MDKGFGDRQFPHGNERTHGNGGGGEDEHEYKRGNGQTRVSW